MAAANALAAQGTLTAWTGAASAGWIVDTPATATALAAIAFFPNLIRIILSPLRVLDNT